VEVDLLCQCLVADLHTFQKCPQSVSTNIVLLQQPVGTNASCSWFVNRLERNSKG